jgi:hypothetical protein
MSQLHEMTDPRTLPDFNPAWMPLFDGGECPPMGTERPALRKVIQFAAHYYAMNRAVALVEAARAGGDAAAEIQALKEVRSASHARDAIEDQFAPEGFLCEPIMEGSRYANLNFTWADKPAPPILTRHFEARLIL